MNRIVIPGFLIALGLVTLAPLTASADVTVEYGIVTSVEEVVEEGHDALVGGLLGDLIEDAADTVDEAVDDDSYFHYGVELIESGETVVIRTEQDDIYEDNCVSVEQGEYANIRRVSSWHCEDETEEPPEHHTEMADACDQAKQQLMAAESEDEINAAVQKVRILCED